jgi:hypothetical protein
MAASETEAADVTQVGSLQIEPVSVGDEPHLSVATGSAVRIGFLDDPIDVDLRQPLCCIRRRSAFPIQPHHLPHQKLSSLGGA